MEEKKQVKELEQGCVEWEGAELDRVSQMPQLFTD
jgi:hypothetical protein